METSIFSSIDVMLYKKNKNKQNSYPITIRMRGKEEKEKEGAKKKKRNELGRDAEVKVRFWRCVSTVDTFCIMKRQVWGGKAGRRV